MNNNQWIVVGRGPGGLLAASLLVRAQQQVTIISKGFGSLGLWGGALDFRSLDPSGHHISDPWSGWQSWIDLSQREWADGWAVWEDIAEQTGMPLSRHPQGLNWQCLNVMGKIQPHYLVPAWQHTYEPRHPASFLSWEGVADFDPTSWAHEVYPSSKVIRRPAPKTWTKRWTPVTWAGFFDTSQGLDWLVNECDAVPGPHPIVAPGILGLDHTEMILATIDQRVRKEVKEIPLVAPALGGMRWQRRWLRWLKRQGVRMVQGTVQEITSAGITLANGRGFQGQVVLATGGILGGGLRVNYNRTIFNTATGELIAWNFERNPLSEVGIVSHAQYGVVGSSAVGPKDAAHLLASVLHWWYGTGLKMKMPLNHVAGRVPSHAV